MSSVECFYCYSEHHNAECQYANCHYAECRCAERRGILPGDGLADNPLRNSAKCFCHRSIFIFNLNKQNIISTQKDNQHFLTWSWYHKTFLQL